MSMRPWKSVCAAAGAAAARASMSAAKPARITRRTPAAADELCIEPPVVPRLDGPRLQISGMEACEQSWFPHGCDERVDRQLRGAWNRRGDERHDGMPSRYQRGSALLSHSSRPSSRDPRECTGRIQTYGAFTSRFAGSRVRGSCGAAHTFALNRRHFACAVRLSPSAPERLREPRTREPRTATVTESGMAESNCPHIGAIESLKQPKAHECEECVKIQARWV